MPTKDPRFSFVVSPETVAAIDDFRFSQKFQTQSDALRFLLQRGLDACGAADAAHSPSDSALRLARSYDGLDVFGKKALEQTAERERERMEAQQHPVRRPLAARGAKQPLDLSAIQPISINEIEPTDLDL